MKFDIWMFVSWIVILLCLSFPETIPGIFRFYGVVFSSVMTVATAKALADEMEEESND